LTGLATYAIQDLSNLKHKSPVTIAGVVENAKVKRTKRGEKMATVTLEDATGSTEVILFPDVFNRVTPLLKSDEPVIVHGTAEVDENMAKVIAQEVATLESERQKAIRSIEIPLAPATTSQEKLEELKTILFRYPGACTVLFRVDTGSEQAAVIAAHKRYRVSPSLEMIGEIESFTGQHVDCRYGKKNSNSRQPTYA
jgi:DNA polymerase-3 subunit alpha